VDIQFGHFTEDFIFIVGSVSLVKKTIQNHYKLVYVVTNRQYHIMLYQVHFVNSKNQCHKCSVNNDFIGRCKSYYHIFSGAVVIVCKLDLRLSISAYHH